MKKTIIFFTIDGVETFVVADCEYKPSAGDNLDIRLERGDLVRLRFSNFDRFVSFPLLDEKTGVITYTTRATQAEIVDEDKDAPELADLLNQETA